jgi:hypothetical protein
MQGEPEGNTPVPDSSERILSAGELQPLTLMNSKREAGKRGDFYVRRSDTHAVALQIIML